MPTERNVESGLRETLWMLAGIISGIGLAIVLVFVVHAMAMKDAETGSADYAVVQ